MPVQLLPFQKLVDMPNLAQRHRRTICGLAIASIVLIFTILCILVPAFIAGFAMSVYSTNALFGFVGIPAMVIILILVCTSSFISLRNTDRWASTDTCCNLMRSNPTCCTKCCAGNKHCCARMSCLHIAASVWTSLFCVLLVVLLFAGCNESDSITRAYESKYPSRRPGRSLRSLGCLERSEKNVKIGSRVTLIADRQAFQNSFNNVPYIWNDAMTSLLGQTVTVVDRPQSGIFGLPKSDPNSNQPVWWYPFSVIACVKDNEATITTRTQPTATTNAEDKCLDVFFAIENYVSCCTNFGYMKKGREPVCRMASPCAKGGMQDPRCKFATKTKAPKKTYHHPREKEPVTNQPTATTNAEDKCLDVFFAIENYGSCCTNFGYMKKGREPVCRMASPCAKGGMQDPRCKFATKTKAPATTTYRDYHYYGSGYRYHPTPERRDYSSSWEQYEYESAKHACSVLAGFEVPALALMICLAITTALSAHLLRKIEQTQPEIELLPAGKMMVVQASCEDTVALIKVNVVDDAQVTNDVSSTPDLKTEQNE